MIRRFAVPLLLFVTAVGNMGADVPIRPVPWKVPAGYILLVVSPHDALMVPWSFGLRGANGMGWSECGGDLPMVPYGKALLDGTVYEAPCVHHESIVECESHWNPLALGAAGEIGLWQINTAEDAWGPLVRSMGYTTADLWNPRVNTLVAVAIWQRTGDFREWSCGKER